MNMMKVAAGLLMSISVYAGNTTNIFEVLHDCDEESENALIAQCANKNQVVEDFDFFYWPYPVMCTENSGNNEVSVQRRSMLKLSTLNDFLPGHSSLKIADDRDALPRFSSGKIEIVTSWRAIFSQVLYDIESRNPDFWEISPDAVSQETASVCEDIVSQEAVGVYEGEFVREYLNEKKDRACAYERNHCYKGSYHKALQEKIRIARILAKKDKRFMHKPNEAADEPSIDQDHKPSFCNDTPQHTMLNRWRAQRDAPVRPERNAELPAKPKQCNLLGRSPKEIKREVRETEKKYEKLYQEANKLCGRSDPEKIDKRVAELHRFLGEAHYLHPKYPLSWSQVVAKKIMVLRQVPPSKCPTKY